MNEIDAIKARREAVTPGGDTWDDVLFAAHAADDITALLAMVDRLTGEVERLTMLWSGASKDIQYLQHDGATWKGLFEDMRQKREKVTEERDALRAELAAERDAAKRHAAYIASCVDECGSYKP